MSNETNEQVPTQYELECCWVTTFTYKGVAYKIFMDDNGQCFYYYYNGKCVTFPTFMPLDACEKLLGEEIDYNESILYRFPQSEYFGGSIQRIKNKVVIMYRLKRLKCVPKKMTALDDQIKFGLSVIAKYKHSKRFIRSEKKRLGEYYK